MRRKVMITAGLSLLTLILIFLSIPLLEKVEVADFVNRNIPKNITTPQPQVELACPQQLGVYHFVDLHDTPSLEDDDVFIAILNTEEHSYNAEVFVDGVSQGKTVLNKDSKTTLKSELITEWWRQGIKAKKQQTEEREDSVEEEEQNQKTFYVDVIIEGCNETIAAMTPTLISVEPKPLAGGGGGGGSRYSISIAKSETEYMPD